MEKKDIKPTKKESRGTRSRPAPSYDAILDAPKSNDYNEVMSILTGLVFVTCRQHVQRLELATKEILELFGKQAT